MGTSNKSEIDFTEAFSRMIICHILPSNKYYMIFHEKKKSQCTQSIQYNFKANWKNFPWFKRKIL